MACHCCGTLYGQTPAGDIEQAFLALGQIKQILVSVHYLDLTALL